MSAVVDSPGREPAEGTRTRAGSPAPWVGFAHLLVVYVIWGSTYLAIRVAVQDGIPPFTLVAGRTLPAGLVLVLWARGRGARLRLAPRDGLVLAASGVLLWIGGNGGVVWAEQWADSGYAALLLSTPPIWIAGLTALIDRRAPSPLLVASLAVGLAGVGLLVAPALLIGRGDAVYPPAVVALVLASLTWSLGSVLQTRRAVIVAPVVSSGIQQLVAGGVLLIAAVAAREPLPSPAGLGWLAWAYLMLFGSLLAFTSYVQVLRLLPLSVVMTYSYVNPVVALFLGWLVLSESLTPSAIAGMLLVLVSVAGVFRDRSRGDAR